MKPIFWIVFIVVLIAGFLITNLWKNSIFNKLLRDLQTQNFDDFTKRLDSLSCRYFYPPFNREYMRLNSYFLMADEQKIKEQFDMMLHMRMNKKQELDICIKAFYFYLDEGNKRKVHELLKRIHEKDKKEEVYTQCRIMSDIMLDHSTAYIDAMEQQVKEAKDMDRGMFHYMLALQYSYLGNTKKEMQHLRSASIDMKGTPYELKINALLKEQKNNRKTGKGKAVKEAATVDETTEAENAAADVSTTESAAAVTEADAEAMEDVAVEEAATAENAEAAEEKVSVAEEAKSDTTEA